MRKKTFKDKIFHCLFYHFEVDIILTLASNVTFFLITTIERLPNNNRNKRDSLKTLYYVTAVFENNAKTTCNQFSRKGRAHFD